MSPLGNGFKQSLLDPCISYNEGITLIFGVDDYLILTREKDLADELIGKLPENKFTHLSLGVTFSSGIKFSTISCK
jgi:hypothetical protein